MFWIFSAKTNFPRLSTQIGGNIFNHVLGIIVYFGYKCQVGQQCLFKKYWYYRMESNITIIVHTKYIMLSSWDTNTELETR